MEAKMLVALLSLLVGACIAQYDYPYKYNGKYSASYHYPTYAKSRSYYPSTTYERTGYYSPKTTGYYPPTTYGPEGYYYPPGTGYGRRSSYYPPTTYKSPGYEEDPYKSSFRFSKQSSRFFRRPFRKFRGKRFGSGKRF